MVDVITKRCQYELCMRRSLYGFVGKSSTRCVVHKEKGMILFPRTLCTSCRSIGIYLENGNRVCETHVTDSIQATNLGIAPCSECKLDDVLTNGICDTCQPEVVERRTHLKENRVRDVLSVHGISFIHNRALESSVCGRERPDFALDCGTHLLCVEVDEHQHRSYTCECEQIRMVNLANIRAMPILFLRYNPDEYEPSGKQKVESMYQREEKLVEWIRYWIHHPPSEKNAVALVHYLFYDGYDVMHPEINVLIPMEMEKSD
jgi:hypothetical protein